MRIVPLLSLLVVSIALVYAGVSSAGPASAQVPPPTTITVLKTCTGVPDPNAEFIIILRDNNSLSPTNDVVDPTIQVGCNEEAVFVFDQDPEDGDLYDVAEDIVAGNVVDADLDGCQNVEPNLNEDEDCEIFNELGDDNTIVVVKNAGGANEEFDFTISAPGGSFPCEDSFTLNDVNSGSDDELVSGCIAGVDYTITETDGPSGWSLVDIQCSDNGDVSYSDSGNGVTVTFDEYGVEVVCTFYNEEEVEDDGVIIIEKDTSPEPDDTLFSFSDDIPGCSIGTLADDGAGGQPNTVTCSGVPAGDYSVTENGSTAYALVDIDCDDEDSGTSVAGATASIDLDPGETVRCIFYNVPGGEGSITISKDTNPETTGVAFDFDGDLGDIDLDDDESVTFTGLATGVYVVTENVNAGWLFDHVTCTGGDVSYSGTSAYITLDAGEHVVCEFVNTQIAGATPTKTPIATPTKTPVVVQPTVGPVKPPSAGSGGLLDDGGVSWVFGVLAVVAATLTAWVFIQRQIRRS